MADIDVEAASDTATGPKPDSNVIVPGGVVRQSLPPIAVLSHPVVVLKSALTPVAVLRVPVLLLSNALSPMAVLGRSAVVHQRAATDGRVIAPGVGQR